MGMAYFFPIPDICDINPVGNNVLQGSPCFLQRFFYISDDLNRLLIGITDADQLTVLTGSRGAGNKHLLANLYCTGITYNRFPSGTG